MASPTHPSPSASRTSRSFERTLVQLRRRLTQEGMAAVAMLESALDALWAMDAERALAVRRRDDGIDREEVEIEEECLRLLTLEHLFARDFRVVAFILKVNADIERVADHACSIAKVAAKLDPQHLPAWPTSLRELGERVPAMCHRLLRAVLDEDVDAAREILAEDDRIDQLERGLFDELLAMMGDDRGAMRTGLLLSRVGRDLERVGDLMVNIAEDVIYLATGRIVRHAAKGGGKPPAPSQPR